MRYIHYGRFVVCAALVLASTEAWAEQGRWYAGIKGGIGGGADASIGSFSRKTKVGPVVMGAAGYAFGHGSRLEGEISWRRNTIKTDELAFMVRSNRIPFTANVQNLAFMVNGAYDFPLHTLVRPFILGGLGVSVVKGTVEVLGTSFDNNKTAFSYQGGAGFLASVIESLSLEVSWRFFGTTSPTYDLGSGIKIDVTNTHHNGLVGLVYSF